VSGHTHDGQMVPFHLQVQPQQPVVSGDGRVDGKIQLWIGYVTSRVAARTARRARDRMQRALG
jgi:hypothetical protein